jgi:hypothetical protein
MPGALDRAHGDCIGHQPRFGACLDDEEATQFLQHGHSLTRERLIRSFEPFRP